VGQIYFGDTAAKWVRFTSALTIIHDNESFHVQWNAQNLGPDSTPVFIDRLVIALRPEGCAGPEKQEETIVCDSDVDGDSADFTQPPLQPGATGPLMAPLVGPFAAGAYRMTVTLDAQGPNPVDLFNCVDIVAAT
jgi:hypothetical protein